MKNRITIEHIDHLGMKHIVYSELTDEGLSEDTLKIIVEKLNDKIEESKRLRSYGNITEIDNSNMAHYVHVAC